MDGPGEEVVAGQMNGGMFLSSVGDGRNQGVMGSGQGNAGYGGDVMSGKDVPLNLEKALANLASEVLHHSPAGLEGSSSVGPHSVPGTAGMKQGGAAPSFPTQPPGTSMTGYAENAQRSDPVQNVGKMAGLSDVQMQILQNYMLQQKLSQLSQGGMSLNAQQQQQRTPAQYTQPQYQNVYAQQQQQQQQRILAGLHGGQQQQPNGVSGMMNRAAPSVSSGAQMYNAMLQQYGVSSSMNNPYALHNATQASQMTSYGLSGMPQSSYGMNTTNAGLHARTPMGQQNHVRMNQLQSEALIAMQRQNSIGSVQSNGAVPQNTVHAASQEVALQNQLVTMARNGMLTPEVMESLSRSGLGHAQVLAIVQRGMQIQSQQPRPPQPVGAMNHHPSTAMNYMNSQPVLRQGMPDSNVNAMFQSPMLNTSGEKPSNPIQTLQDIGKTLSNLGISVEAAVNAGLLGGLSAADVRIVSDAHRLSTESKMPEGEKSVHANSTMSNHIAAYMKEHGSHLARSSSVPGNASAPAPGSPAGSVGGMSTASLPVNLNVAPTSPAEKKSNSEDLLLDQMVQSDNEKQNAVKNSFDEDWVKAKVESSMANFDAGQYGFFGIGDNPTGDGIIEHESIEDPGDTTNKQPSDAGSFEDAKVPPGCKDAEEMPGNRVEQGGDRLSSYLAGLKLGTGF